MINRITIDTSECVTELCKIMGEQGTDKSPLVSPLLGNSTSLDGIIDREYIQPGYPYKIVEYAHAYMGIYDFLFSSLRNKKIKFGEIGVHYNHSIRGWKEYFPKAEIHGFEWMQEFIDSAKNENLKNVYYHWTNVYQKEEINKSFEQANGNKEKFDIIIEDSCHFLSTQLNVAETVHKYLKPGGILVIEDIYPQIGEFGTDKWDDYLPEILDQHFQSVQKYYSNMVLVTPSHKYKYTGQYGEVRMLVLHK